MKLTFENGHIYIAYMDHPVVRRPVTLTDNLFRKVFATHGCVGSQLKIWHIDCLWRSGVEMTRRRVTQFSRVPGLPSLFSAGLFERNPPSSFQFFLTEITDAV